jgi:hypothetical protein
VYELEAAGGTSKEGPVVEAAGARAKVVVFPGMESAFRFPLEVVTIIIVHTHNDGPTVNGARLSHCG